jgi:hypothetical protein
MFESGSQDLHPDRLNLVMAMVAGNSIYVSESLLENPSKPDRSDLPPFRGIQRIISNLDRLGIVMLVPPQAPRIRELDLKSWKLVQQGPFDGASDDYFNQTSLHLSFTDYEIPLAVEPGAFDAEVVMLEALISVHDGRHWVADQDVLGSLASPNLKFVAGCQCVRPPKQETLGRLLVTEFGVQLKSIENWDELLCAKDNLLISEIGVVRAYNNWLSRLATVAVCARKGYSTVLLASHCICSTCSKWLLSRKLWLTEDGEQPDVLIA